MRSVAAIAIFVAVAQAVALPADESVSNPAVQFLTQTNSGGAVTGQPEVVTTQPAVVTTQPAVVTSQPAVATVPAGLSVSNGVTFTITPTVISVSSSAASSGSAASSEASSGTAAATTSAAGTGAATNGTSTKTSSHSATGTGAANTTTGAEGAASVNRVGAQSFLGLIAGLAIFAWAL